MAADPTVWILWRRRAGDLQQMLAAMRALGWRHEIKTLRFGGPDIPALAPWLLKRGSSPLEPPWPDIVMCAEALPSIIATRLKRRSAGAVRTVCIGRPAGAAAAFDLVVTTPQYRIPPAANVVTLSMPLALPEMSTPAAFSGARPLVVLAVGGPSAPDRLDASVADTLWRRVRDHAETLGGTLVAVTSPRSGSAATAALAALAAAPHRLQIYGAPGEDYRALLAAADEIVVTSDSVSMLGDALQTGKPVSIYALPRSENLTWRAAEWLYENAVLNRAAWLAPAAWLFDAGVIESSADRALLARTLVAQGRARWFGAEPCPPAATAPSDDLARAVESLRALVTRRP